MQRIEEVKQAIQQVKAQRGILGEIATNAALEGLHEKLKQLQSESPERKQVTILFADISGFTALSENLDHEETMGLMNRVWQKLDQAILNFGGKIDKHIGDAVMALFGIPTAQEDDPERAIFAALAMQEEIKAHGLKIRIGLHTGLVSLGKVGVTEEYTAMGDAVNLASRIESAAPKGGILISHQLYSHIIGIFLLEKLKAIQVKGKSNSIQVYLVRKKLSRSFRLLSPRVEGIETPTIGRRIEMQHCQKNFESMSSKQSLHMVTLAGEAGIGKSRLLYEFEQWSDLHPTEFWLWRSRTTQNEQNSAYFLMRTLFEFRFEIQEGEDQEKAKEKLVKGMIEWVGEIGEKYAHFIGHLLGFDFTASPHLKGILNSPKQAQQQAFWLSIELFQSISKIHPLVFYLEDLHWADQGSLEWLNHLLEHCSSYPLLLIVTCRPIFLANRPSWGEGLENCSRLFLGPLNKKESQELVQAILCNLPKIPLKIQNLILEKSEGSPFCIEELIKMLLEERVILKKEEEEWEVNLDRLTHLKVPSTLTGILQARFDSLPPQEKEVLHCASVVGRIFWDQAVHFLREDTTPLRPLLESLRQKEMLLLRKQSIVIGCQEFLFKHALLQEVVYESVLQENRRKYHQKAAHWMQEKGVSTIDGAAGVIARHYELAKKKEQAALWYYQAGEKAKESYSLPEAIRFYDLALFLFPKLEKYQEKKMSCYRELGEMLLWKSEIELARGHFQNLLQFAEKCHDPLWQARAYNKIALVHGEEGTFHEGVDCAKQAEQILKQAEMTQHQEYAESLYMKAAGLSYLPQPSEDPLNLLQQALATFIKFQNHKREANTYILIGSIYEVVGNWQQAESYYSKALEKTQALKNQELLSPLFLNLGELQRKLGDMPAALEYYQKSLSIAHDNHFNKYVLCCSHNMSGAYLELQEYALAEEKILFVLSSAPDRWVGLSESYCFLSQNYLKQGKWEQSFSAAKKSLSLAQEHQYSELLALSWQVLGMVAIDCPRGALIIEKKEHTPDSCFAESIRIFQEAKMEAYQAKTLYLWAIHQWKIGKQKEARNKWEKAKSIFAKLNMPIYLEKMESWPPSE